MNPLVLIIGAIFCNAFALVLDEKLKKNPNAFWILESVAFMLAVMSLAVIFK